MSIPLGNLANSKVKKHKAGGAATKGFLPANRSKKPGFKSKTRGIKDPTC